MKLTKVSLAALVALGTFSTASFAAPLEEAIKGVDASGYLRYRYTATNVDKGAESAGHEFKSGLTLSTPVSDSVKATVNATYLEKPTTSSDRGDTATAGSAFNVDQYYATITPAATKTTIIAGKKVIGVPVTDDSKANGVWVINSDINNVTLVGAYLDNLMYDGDASTLKGGLYKDINVYAAAAVLSFSPVTAQVWYFNVPNTVDALVFGEVSGKMDLGGSSVGLKGQYAMMNADDSLKGAVNDSTFWGLEATGSVSMVGLKAGITGQEVDDATTGATSLVSFEDVGAYIGAGEQARYEADPSGFGGEWMTYFVGASVAPMDGLKLSLDFVAMDEDISKTDVTEIVGTVNYKYNKNWNIKSYYSSMDVDPAGAGNTVTDKFRFEAKYSF